MSSTVVRGSNMTMKQRKQTGIIIRWIVALILIFFAVFPVIFTLSASFNPSDSLATQTLLPRNASLDNYR